MDSDQTPRQAAIYVRISEDATGKKAGVTRQLKECRALAKRLKWPVIDTYDDNDVSAFSGKTRPGFERLLGDIKTGRVDAVICWHPDRLYRRVRDLQRLVEITDQGVTIASVNGGELDLSTATGKMMARILGSVAEQESEHKGERRVLANEQRGASGAWRADAPRVFGYTQGGKGKPGVPLEPEAQAVRQAAADVLAGISLRSIAIAWNEAGLRTPKAKKKGGVKWTNLQLRRLLMRPVYAGLRTYRGSEPVVGDWEPLYDEETWRGLVALLSDESRRPASRFVRKHLGSGVYTCGKCGKKLYASYPHGSGRPMAYVCKPTKHLGRSGEQIDRMVEGYVVGLLEDSDLMKRLAKRPGVDTFALRTKRNALQARKDELATLFADGILDGPAVKREAEKLATKITELNQALAEAARTSTAATLLEDGPSGVRRHWDSASPDVRGKVVDELVTVTVMPETGRGCRLFDPNLILIEQK